VRGADERLNRAIDLTVRQMLDVEQPAGLRGRVLDRMSATDRGVARGFSRKIGWLALPVAAAAILIRSVAAPWRTVAPPAIAPPVAKVEPVAMPPAQPPQRAEPRSRRAAPPDRRPIPLRRRAPAADADRTVIAATIASAEDASENSVAPLSVPDSLVIPQLVTPPTPPLSSTAPEPIRIRALEINALPETPRERREE